MKKYLVHTILLATVLFSQLCNTVITAIYQINYDYYSNVLCENQDKPELHCDGKCYFSKQLQLTQNSQDNTEPPTLLPSLTFFTDHFATKTPPIYIVPKETTSIAYIDEGTRSPYSSAIDHPPKV